MRKSDQKMPVYFVKMSAEFHRSCCETRVCAVPSSSYESRSSPTLLKQLVELEFFSDVGGVFSDGLLSRCPSELERTLGSTLPPASCEEQATASFDCGTETNAAVITDDALVDSCNATNTDQSFKEHQINAAGDIEQLYNKTDWQSLFANDEMLAGDAGQSIYACGSLPTADVGSSVVSDTDRPTSTLSSALSVERSCSDIDSETYPLMAESELVDGLTDGFCSGLASFAGSVLQARLLSTVALMNTIHRRCLETMISLAFDMAWDVIGTPTRIKFARTKEVKSTLG